MGGGRPSWRHEGTYHGDHIHQAPKAPSLYEVCFLACPFTILECFGFQKRRHLDEKKGVKKRTQFWGHVFLFLKTRHKKSGPKNGAQKTAPSFFALVHPLDKFAKNSGERADGPADEQADKSASKLAGKWKGERAGGLAGG